MEISVVIVSYNTADLIGPCLGSVIGQTGGDKEIRVVDNASPDGSAALIAAGFPDIHLIANKENKGFAAANNQVITHCRGRYILFLNPDTVLKENCLATALAYMEKHPEIGLAGLHILNPDGTDQDSVSRRYLSQRYTSGELSNLPGGIACVLGAAMIAPRKAIISVGGFDEDYFLYGEDEDLCLRIRRTGLKIGFIDAARVVHYHGQSERKSTSAEVWRKKISAEYLFYHKHYQPETIARITKAEMLKTHWRILTLRICLPFIKNKGEAREKLNKYKVIHDELRRRKLSKE
ncbi:MAG: glycosyltransferase family 2 protein [Deltaproteobacteria bacterium]|nr:glycosyltransferase family 2 protein [Deltaproteobacteria bacterium]